MNTEPTEQRAAEEIYNRLSDWRWFPESNAKATIAAIIATALHEREEQVWAKVMQIANATKADELWYALEQAAAQPKDES